MNSKISRRFEMFARVKAFGVKHADALPARAAALLTQIGANLDSLRTHGTDQVSGANDARAGTLTRKELAADIHSRMTAIVRVARVLDHQQHPGASKLLRVPRRGGYQELLNAARSFAAEAAPIKQAFVDRGEEPTFLEDLSAKIDAFDTATSRKGNGQQTQVGGTAGLGQKATFGAALVQELDAIVQNRFRGNVAVLAEWKSASHTTADPQRNSDVEGTGASAGPAATSAAESAPILATLPPPNGNAHRAGAELEAAAAR